MTLKQEKIIASIWATIAILASFEALVYILNLNEQAIYLHLALAIGVYVTIHIAFLYDLHFKSNGVYACKMKGHNTAIGRIACYAGMFKQYLANRLRHFTRWQYLRHWINVLGLPWLMYWATVAILFLHFHREGIQQVFVVCSTAALSLAFWYLKEIYENKGQNISKTCFAVLQVIKLYSAFVIFAAALGLARYFCLGYTLYVLAVFGSIVTLMYQSLFHMQRITAATVAAITAIGIFLSLCAGLVFLYWGLNYFTAGLFLMGLYNFAWGLYSHKLMHGLTRQVVFEFILVLFVVSALSIGTTNFRARLLPYC